mmetsp:Transcript_39266/g.76667  ORF Transcript_39266/g.76667 Transcript_39266/m.76667 type:complete len:294 (-) Transcript_39266:52-933(-)
MSNDGGPQHHEDRDGQREMDEALVQRASFVVRREGEVRLPLGRADGKVHLHRGAGVGETVQQDLAGLLFHVLHHFGLAFHQVLSKEAQGQTEDNDAKQDVKDHKHLGGFGGHDVAVADGRDGHNNIVQRILDGQMFRHVAKHTHTQQNIGHDQRPDGQSGPQSGPRHHLRVEMLRDVATDGRHPGPGGRRIRGGSGVRVEERVILGGGGAVGDLEGGGVDRDGAGHGAAVPRWERVGVRTVAPVISYTTVFRCGTLNLLFRIYYANEVEQKMMTSVSNCSNHLRCARRIYKKV